MIRQVTIDKLHDLRLSPMADAFEHQCQSDDYTALSFEDRFGMLVDRQWESMKNNKLAKLRPTEKSNLRHLHRNVHGHGVIHPHHPDVGRQHGATVGARP